MKLSHSDTMKILVDKFNELVEFVQPIKTDMQKGETLAEYLTRILDNALEQVAIARKEGTPRLASFPYILEPTNIGQTEFEIPLVTFNPDMDTILIFRNRTALSTEDYVIKPSRTKFKIVLSESVDVVRDTSLFVIVLKNVPVGEDGPIDASLTIKSGTVTEEKIDPKYRTDVATKIENKADNDFAIDLSNTLTDMVDVLGLTPAKMSPTGVQSVVKLYARRVLREQTFAVENVPEPFRDQVIVMVSILQGT